MNVTPTPHIPNPSTQHGPERSTRQVSVIDAVAPVDRVSGNRDARSRFDRTLEEVDRKSSDRTKRERDGASVRDADRATRSARNNQSREERDGGDVATDERGEVVDRQGTDGASGRDESGQDTDAEHEDTVTLSDRDDAGHEDDEARESNDDLDAIIARAVEQGVAVGASAENAGAQSVAGGSGHANGGGNGQGGNGSANGSGHGSGNGNGQIDGVAQATVLEESLENSGHDQQDAADGEGQDDSGDVKVVKPLNAAGQRGGAQALFNAGVDASANARASGAGSIDAVLPGAGAGGGAGGAGGVGGAEATGGLPMPNASESGEDANVARVGRGLRTALQQQGGTVNLRLAPAELGTVRITMQLVDGVVRANIVTQSESVRAMMTQQLATLRRGLEGQGLSVESLTVHAAPSSTSSSSSGSSMQNDEQLDQGQQQNQNNGRSRGFADAQNRQQEDAETRNSSASAEPMNFSDALSDREN